MTKNVALEDLQKTVKNRPSFHVHSFNYRLTAHIYAETCIEWEEYYEKLEKSFVAFKDEYLKQVHIRKDKYAGLFECEASSNVPEGEV